MIIADDILSMEAGPEMDALVGEWVFGLQWRDYHWWDGSTKQLLWPPSWGEPKGDDFHVLDEVHIIPWDFPRHSTDNGDAWEVVKQLEYNWNIVRDMGKCGNDYETEGDKMYHVIYSAPGMPMYGVKAETMPLAICRSALLAALKQDPQP